MHIWTEKVVRPIRDELLVRSAREFRHLLDQIESMKPSCQGRYIQEIRRGLHLMKEELARRGLEVEALVHGTPHRRAALSGAEQAPEVLVQRKPYVWKKVIAPLNQRDRSGDAPPRKRTTSSGRPAVPPRRHRGA